MYIIKLAVRNLFGKGLRSWLNFLVLSFAYVAIIWMQGMNNGMMQQAAKSIIDEEIAQGQYWSANYDPFDPFSLDDSLIDLPENLSENDVPIIFSRAIAYPKNSMRAVILKGIDPEQNLLSLPTHVIKAESDQILGFIGKRMAKSSGLSKGDLVTIRWKNSFGAYDANEIKIAKVVTLTNPNVDLNQIWISDENLKKMIKVNRKATIIVSETKDNKNYGNNWKFKTEDFLLKDIKDMIAMKSAGATVFYFILIFLAVINIFDTQVLSLFQRRKEMGTMMALGLTRMKLVLMFTLEGFLNAIMAVFIGAIYGLPLLFFTAKNGIGLPKATDDYGIAGISTLLYPVYSAKLVLGTVLLIFVIITIVSYLPSKKISKLEPTDALRGRWTEF